MISKVFQGLRLLIVNPSLFAKYFASNLKQLSSQWKNFKPITPVIHMNGVLFPIDFARVQEEKYVKQMYFQKYQIAAVEFMKRNLKKGDIFIDVGASAGYLSAVALSLVGEEGEIHCFEPVPSNFLMLKQFLKMNPHHKIKLNQRAVGAANENIKMEYTGPLHSGGSTLITGFLDLHQVPVEGVIEVETVRLDSYIEKNIPDKKIAMIKIDVEGFEFPVLRGLQGFFEKTGQRPIIICEITPSAYPFLKTTRDELVAYMKRYGYAAYDLMAPYFKIDITKFIEGTDVVFKTL